MAYAVVAVPVLVFRTVPAFAGNSASLGSDRPSTAEPRAEPRAEPSARDAEDMVACPVCQAYVQVRGAMRCDRSDCPY